ncbi:MAG: response regulator [Planctomycetia bacterium]
MWRESRTTPGTVLIAEEHEECRQLFRQFLERCGYEVQTVPDGEHCASLLQRGCRPDVLVLSWELSRESDGGVWEWLRAGGSESLATVALTARMDPDFRRQEAEFPHIKWVQRPFRLTELLAAVQSADRDAYDTPRCLEALWRKATKPRYGVLFDSHASVREITAASVPASYTSGDRQQAHPDSLVVCQLEDRL